MHDRDLQRLTERFDDTTLARIVLQHFGNLAFVVARDTVGQHVNGVASFDHVVACGLYARHGVRTRYIEFVNAVLDDKCGEFLARERIALGLGEYIVRRNVHIRDQHYE